MTGAIGGTPTLSSISVATISAITSATTAPATVGTPFVTSLTGATRLPTSYGTTDLPAGLAVKPLAGTITGTPTTAGTFVAAISATISGGTGIPTLVIVVAAPTAAPIVTTSAPATVGAACPTYLFATTGLPTRGTATRLPAGLGVNGLTGAINGTPITAGTSLVTPTATNALGSSSRRAEAARRD